MHICYKVYMRVYKIIQTALHTHSHIRTQKKLLYEIKKFKMDAIV